jgi:ribosomal protein L17
MRHKVAGYKLGRNTAHRRSLLRNLVTSVIVEERIETTVPKAKAARPIVEKMITLGKRGDLAARRLAGAYLMTDEALVKLFDTVGPRFGDREGGYTRIIPLQEGCRSQEGDGRRRGASAARRWRRAGKGRRQEGIVLGWSSASSAATQILLSIANEARRTPCLFC